MFLYACSAGLSPCPPCISLLRDGCQPNAAARPLASLWPASMSSPADLTFELALALEARQLTTIIASTRASAAPTTLRLTVSLIIGRVSSDEFPILETG